MTRTESILRHLLGPGSKLPTIGMIAAGTGYTRSYICYLFLGSRRGSLEALAAVAGYLGVGLEALHAALRHPPTPPPPKARPKPRKPGLILRGRR